VLRPTGIGCAKRSLNDGDARDPVRRHAPARTTLVPTPPPPTHANVGAINDDSACGEVDAGQARRARTCNDVTQDRLNQRHRRFLERRNPMAHKGRRRRGVSFPS